MTAGGSVIRLANYGSQPYVGWVRTKTDTAWPDAWTIGDTLGVMGAWEGDARVVDVRVTLSPGQVLELDPSQAQATTFVVGALPANPIEHFGLPTVGGDALRLQSATADGAAYVFHLVANHAGLLLTNVWLWWYPDQPGFCHGEVLTVASDPVIPDMVAPIPADFTLRLGKAHVLIPGPGEAAGFPPHPVVRDPATGALGVKVGIVRDPVTGWTFDTMRQQFDAARTTVRVLAAELVAARQQIAGTNGFEAKEGG